MSIVRVLLGILSVSIRNHNDLNKEEHRFVPFKWVGDDEVHVRHQKTGEEFVITVRRKS